jgi:hypothetical protein
LHTARERTGELDALARAHGTLAGGSFVVSLPLYLLIGRAALLARIVVPLLITRLRALVKTHRAMS